MKRIRSTGDIVLALLVLAVAVMLLVPIPTILLDFLITTNLAFSFLFLLAGLYISNPQSLLVFPSLLLLTTLFRLGLNVASCRLILSQGDAGRVIESFGTYLLQENIVVGLLIFIIITIVNFIVIAKGSARVSEVAARFVLDSLPGKQVAIDSDLRNGNLTPEQAKRKREELRQESQLYGSMDGAMRFVQGDAVAGFFIIVINILGGIYIGLSQGMSFPDAIHSYTILTVGDGLVSQIPALLISICAGIVVTRVFTDENSTLGSDLSDQLFVKSEIMMLAGMMVVFVGFLPGLPWFPFITVGLTLVGFGGYQKRFKSRAKVQLDIESSNDYPQLNNTSRSNFKQLTLQEDEAEENKIEILLDQDTLFKFYKTNTVLYKDIWKIFQKNFFEELGLKLPEINIKTDPTLHFSSYKINYKGDSIDEGALDSKRCFVSINPVFGEPLGINVYTTTLHPIHNTKSFWTTNNQITKEILVAGDFQFYDVIEFIFLKVSVFFLRNPNELINISDVHYFFKNLEKKFPGFTSEVVNKNIIDIPRLTEIIHILLNDLIDIKEFKNIIETVSTYCSNYKSQLSDDGNFDFNHLISFIRISRRRNIIAKCLNSNKVIKCIMLSEETETIFEDAEENNLTSSVIIDPENYEQLYKKISEIIQKVKNSGILPISIVCKNEIRIKVNNFLKYLSIYDSVVSFDEIDPFIEVVQIEIW